MIYKIVGYVDSTGEYQGKKYHNYNLSCQYTNDRTHGTCCNVIKVSAENMSKILEKNNVDIDDIIGYQFDSVDDLFFDSFQRVKMINFNA